MKRFSIILMLTLITLNSQAVLPDVVLRDIDGHAVNIAELAQTGKPVILSFFATWCKPCIQELKAIDELYADWQDESGVEMYIVSIDQGQDSHKVKPLVDGNSWDYHVLLDPNGTLKREMNVQNIPHLFVLNSKGEIVYTHTGYIDGDETEIRTYLR